MRMFLRNGIVVDANIGLEIGIDNVMVRKPAGWLKTATELELAELNIVAIEVADQLPLQLPVEDEPVSP